MFYTNLCPETSDTELGRGCDKNNRILDDEFKIYYEKLLNNKDNEVVPVYPAFTYFNRVSGGGNQRKTVYKKLTKRYQSKRMKLKHKGLRLTKTRTRRH